MTFKPGDRVRYKNLNSEWDGWEGTVQDQLSYVVRAFTTKPADGVPHGKEVHLSAVKLELITPPFTFADIQVGDKIRRTHTRPTGTTEVREGVVTHKNANYALDTEASASYILAYSSDGHPDKPQVKLELLERPEPKQIWEDAPVGTKIKRKTPYGWTFFLKKEDGWEALYGASGGIDFYSNPGAADIFKTIGAELFLVED